jgi:hypothetical protein
VKIDRVSYSRVAIALHETFRTAIRETDSIDAIRVEIHASGRVGIGYATATPAITGDTVEGIESFLDQTVIPYLIGREIHSSRGAGQSDSANQPLRQEDARQVAGVEPQLRKEQYVLGAQSNSLFGIPMIAMTLGRCSVRRGWRELILPCTIWCSLRQLLPSGWLLR